MITVQEADRIISEQVGEYGAEIIPFELSLGRVLAENIKADRDLPPFNRVTVDGIAIDFDSILNGISTFKIKAVQAAGEVPIAELEPNECIEIMTGAALPACADTVIRYEDLEIRAGLATLIVDGIKQGQNIHYQGVDKTQGEILATEGQLITPSVIGIIASVGEAEIRVKKLPRVVILSSGDELVEVAVKPSPFQIRRSNNYSVGAILQQQNIEPVILHLPDDPDVIRKQLKDCIENYDVLLMSGGVSMGKFDHIPKVLAELQVEQLFHKVQQRPGKPFWFGKSKQGALVFAFPGNPVATFMCMYRYFLPWLNATLGKSKPPVIYAMLDNLINFEPSLTYFLQVKLYFSDQCQLMATPVEGNGSGDYANLTYSNAFMQLPIEVSVFKAGEIYPVEIFNFKP